MKRLINNIISILFSFIKFCLLKLFYGKRFKFHYFERFSPNTDIYYLDKGRIILGKAIRAHSLCRFRVLGKGVLIIDDQVAFNYGCMINASELIHIGKGVECGPNVLMYDHDHDFRHASGLKANKYKTGKIEIGENTWIGANTVILRNTIIGRNCVVAAGCVLGNCEYPDNTLIYQKRETQTKEITREQ